MLPCHYADKVLNDRDRYSAAIPGLPNCSTAHGWWNVGVPAEAIRTGLREACVKEDYLKRSIALIIKEWGYLMEAFTSLGFYLHESAVYFILVGISSLKQEAIHLKAEHRFITDHVRAGISTFILQRWWIHTQAVPKVRRVFLDTKRGKGNLRRCTMR